jgi:ATP-dependent Clp protease protease subunit
MRNRLLNLFRNNAEKGRGVVAEGNVVYIYDFIAGSESDAQWWGGISAEGFAKQLNAMQGDVEVRIDSPGGDVFGGRAIAQAIRDYPGIVTCRIDGLAASAASYIAIAGDKVVAAPGAFMMIHRAWTLAMGNCEDLRATATVLDKIDGSIAASYAAKAGEGDQDWVALMSAETWLTADEAVEMGLVDEVLAEQSNKSQARVAWNLAAFSAPPAAAQVQEPAPIVEEVEEEPQQEAADENEIAARTRRLTVDLLSRAA